MAVNEQKKIKVHFAKHVYLTIEEAKKLLFIIGDDQELRYWIIQLDNYLEKTPSKSYASHYLTILNWRRRFNARPQYQKEFETAKEIY